MQPCLVILYFQHNKQNDTVKTLCVLPLLPSTESPTHVEQKTVLLYMSTPCTLCGHVTSSSAASPYCFSHTGHLLFLKCQGLIVPLSVIISWIFTKLASSCPSSLHSSIPSVGPFLITIFNTANSPNFPPLQHSVSLLFSSSPEHTSYFIFFLIFKI